MASRIDVAIDYSIILLSVTDFGSPSWSRILSLSLILDCSSAVSFSCDALTKNWPTSFGMVSLHVRRTILKY